MPGRLPVNQRGWAWELKQPGSRTLAVIDGDAVDLLGPEGEPVTGAYPALARLARDLGGRRMVLDGVLADGCRQVCRNGPCYRVFDLLSVDGQDLVAEPYLVRRRLLASLALTRSAIVEVPPHHQELTPAQLAQLAREHDAPGIIGKHLTSPYQPGHASPDWVELDLLRGCEAVIGGWQPDPADTERLESVLLGVYDEAQRLVHIGRVGKGFTDASRRALGSILNELSTDTCPFARRPPASNRNRPRWVTPTLVADIDYRAIDHNGQLRRASWRGLRTDIDPHDPIWSGSLRLQLLRPG
ncbi:ATP-dependent DNA ligase [Amycolatopsis nivea]|uniref:ATP dependent DNA ligase n=1 Tax=Amycolatopsis nivea TaxID=1644109 RepID=UPI001431C54A|nr:hypothetical protein [Amycolatopsis nivea]